MSKKGEKGSKGDTGVCEYRAKFNCRAEALQESKNDLTLLIPPTMIDTEKLNDSINDELVVQELSVKEGDSIELVCEAIGTPKPSYVWRRVGRRALIVVDPILHVKSNMIASGKVLLADIDRLEIGRYECLANNGIPPVAKKFVDLNVEYLPTIRVFPGPSFSEIKLGSNLTIEYLVESNPASGSIELVFNNDLKLNNVSNEKYHVNSTSGHLTLKSHYTLISLTIYDIQVEDIGIYKCIAANNLGTTTGLFLILPSKSKITADGDYDRVSLLNQISKQTEFDQKFEPSFGWPSKLTSRPPMNYTIFGRELRKLSRYSAYEKLQALELGAHKLQAFRQKLHEFVSSNSLNVSNIVDSKNAIQAIEIETSTSVIENQNASSLMNSDNKDGGNEELICRQYGLAKDKKILTKKSLLEQVGKPVFLGKLGSDYIDSVPRIRWWSCGSDANFEFSQENRCFASKRNFTYLLYEFKSFSDFSKYQADVLSQSKALNVINLNEPMLDTENSLVIHDKYLYYISPINSTSTGDSTSVKIIKYDLDQRLKKSEINFSKEQLTGISRDDSIHSSHCSMQLMSDETGLWLVSLSEKFVLQELKQIDARRLFVFNITLSSSSSDSRFEISNQLEVNLDWQLADKLIVIEGILYGFGISSGNSSMIEAGSAASSLRFALDLQTCNLLMKRQQVLISSLTANTTLISYKYSREANGSGKQQKLVSTSNDDEQAILIRPLRTSEQQVVV